MPELTITPPIFEEAEKKESEYDWLGAAESYKKILGLVPENSISIKSETLQNLGYALYQASLQAKTRDEFQKRLEKALASYRDAESLEASQMTGRRMVAEAMLAYLGFWLASEPAEKKRLVNRAWQLTKDALKHFRDESDPVQYGRIYSRLSMASRFVYRYEDSLTKRYETIKDALTHGEEAITLLSTINDSKDLARAYVRTAGDLEVLALHSQEPAEQNQLSERAKKFWATAKKISEEEAFLAFPTVSGWGPWDWSSGTDDAFAFFNKELDYCRKTGNRFLVGTALLHLAIQSHWRGDTTEDPEKKSESYSAWVKYARESTREYSAIGYASGNPMFCETPDSHYHWHMAQVETDSQKRRDLLKRAVEEARHELKLAQPSKILWNNVVAYTDLYSSLNDLAKTCETPDEKHALLQEALDHATVVGELQRDVYPFDYFVRGVHQSGLGNIKSQLSNLAKDPATRKTLLEDAVAHKENAARFFGNEVAPLEKGRSYALIARMGLTQQNHGRLLISLYEQTRDKECLKKASLAFEEVAQLFQKGKLPSRMAECYWGAAQAYDILGNHVEAGVRFTLASAGYRSASESLPKLRTLYLEYATYMEAWNEIELARDGHARQDYSLAKKHYETAADLHRSTRQWAFFAVDYSALAQVENAEDLSRKEEEQDAIEAFREAHKLFQESKKTLMQTVDRIEDEETKQMMNGLLGATDSREAYCNARILLEEARILDKEGKHSLASEKYRASASSFQKLFDVMEFEETKKEIKLILTLTRAWEMTARAEAEASPKLCLEASRFFEEAKELSSHESTRNLALGHSWLCKGLEAGARFSDTREPTLYTSVVRDLDVAATYYSKAGLDKASNFAGATKLLFDFYLRVDQANSEADDEKKAKLYLAAEKTLQASADSYLIAGHPGKREQVIRLLDRVRKDRELALSVTELLHTSSIISTTATFSTPTPVYEKSAGLGRFEHADLQANVIAQQRTLRVGERLEVEIELVNAGRGAAQLIKVEEVLPHGFELLEKPDQYRVEDGFLNLKGRTLGSLKTEEVRLVFKPMVQGVFAIKPRILYLDEDGNYKSHQPEPVEITVKELGISGWIRGR